MGRANDVDRAAIRDKEAGTGMRRGGNAGDFRQASVAVQLKHVKSGVLAGLGRAGQGWIAGALAAAYHQYAIVRCIVVQIITVGDARRTAYHRASLTVQADQLRGLAAGDEDSLMPGIERHGKVSGGSGQRPHRQGFARGPIRQGHRAIVVGRAFVPED